MTRHWLTWLRAAVPFLLAIPAFAQCGNTNGDLSYACDSLGLTSLKYRNIEYFDINGWSRTLPLTYGATFSDNTQPGNGSRTATSGSNYSEITFAANSAYSYRLRLTYSIPDAGTLKIAVTISNLSPAASLTGLKPLVIANLSVPTPYKTVLDGSGTPVNGSIGTFLAGSNVSIAYFTTNYSDYWFAQRVGTYPNQPDAAHDRVHLGLGNTQSNGPVTLTSAIAPLSSKSLDVYIRFGAPDANPSQILSEALATLRSALPAQLVWPDRRPIATWFLSDYGHASDKNPRGWFNDPTCNCTDQAVFHDRLQATLQQLLRVVNVQPVRPQAIVLWDMEGQEFPQVMTYVGNPPLLHALAPEMDAEIDSVLATLQANGYRVGMTLRPNKIPAGTPLPSSCNYNANPDYTDRFLLIDGPPRGRYFVCNSSGTFSSGGGIGDQMSYTTISGVVAELASKVSYARNRWGASVFYVDSVVWSGGAVFSYNVWQQLQNRFPGTLFLPEEKSDLHYAYTAPYADAHQGNFWTSGAHRLLYPSSFAAINLGNSDATEIGAGFADVDGVKVARVSGPGFVTTGVWNGQPIRLNGVAYTIQSVSSANVLTLSEAAPTQTGAIWRTGKMTDLVKTGMTGGDIYLYPGWYSNWQQDAVAAMFQEANYTATVTDTATGKVRPFTGSPGHLYTLPVMATVTFGRAIADLASSTATCAGGAACSIDLSGMGFYQLSYFDLAGNPIFQDPPSALN